jgi:hypothetical protein
VFPVRYELILYMLCRRNSTASVASSWLQNGDVLCFLWGTNWIYVCYIEESRPPLGSSSQSSWLQFQRPWFDSLRYQIFWEVVGLERGQLSPVTTIEELLWRESSGSGLEKRENAVGIHHADHVPPTSGGCSVGIVRSRTQVREFSLAIVKTLLWFCPCLWSLY